MSTPASPTRRFSPSLAAASLAALAAGAVLGVWGGATEAGWVATLAAFTEPLGRLWMNALQATVVPLVVTQLLAVLVRAERPSRLGRTGVGAVALFVAFLVVAGLATLAVTPLVLGLVPSSPDLLAALDAGSGAVEAAVEEGELVHPLVGLVPSNLFAALAEGDILAVLIATVVFGAAAGRLPAERRRPLAELFRSLATATMTVVGWVLLVTPVGVFALLLTVSLDAGLQAVGIVGLYVALLSALLVLATLVLYPLTAVVGRTGLAAFARAALPAQLVAAGTQSSLASLPALVEGAEDELDLSESATGFVLPLAVATFRLNQAIYLPFTLLFFAHVLGISLGPTELGAFLFYTVLTSFSTPGVPRGAGPGASAALYLAMGLPIEVVVLVEAVQTVPDVFMTTLNVTGDMSVAALLGRDDGDGGGRPAPDAAGTPETTNA